jgi:hypothetical protein
MRPDKVVEALDEHCLSQHNDHDSGLRRWSRERPEQRLRSQSEERVTGDPCAASLSRTSELSAPELPIGVVSHGVTTGS